MPRLPFGQDRATLAAMNGTTSIFGRARNSLRGLRQAWRRERSWREQVGLSLVALVLLALVGAEPVEWLVVVVVLGAGLGVETMNAAVEALADKLHPERDAEIGAAKDIAAGAAFIVNCTAGGVTLAVLLRHLAG